jgi:hypothetical protein
MQDPYFSEITNIKYAKHSPLISLHMLDNTFAQVNKKKSLRLQGKCAAIDTYDDVKNWRNEQAKKQEDVKDT